MRTLAVPDQRSTPYPRVYACPRCLRVARVIVGELPAHTWQVCNACRGVVDETNADAPRHTVTMVPLARLSKRTYFVDGVGWEGSKHHCPVCGFPASQSDTHADGMPILALACQVHPELNPIGYTLEQLQEQYAALDRWRAVERRRAPDAY